jgi:hypothetical protein
MTMTLMKYLFSIYFATDLKDFKDFYHIYKIGVNLCNQWQKNKYLIN